MLEPEALESLFERVDTGRMLPDLNNTMQNRASFAWLHMWNPLCVSRKPFKALKWNPVIWVVLLLKYGFFLKCILYFWLKCHLRTEFQPSLQMTKNTIPNFVRICYVLLRPYTFLTLLLTVHHAMILGNCPTWRTNSFQYIYL